MNVVCRACLKVHKRFFNISENLRSNKLISDMLTECTTIKIQKDDGLPVNICCNCLDRLNAAYDFRAMVIESDIKLCNFYYNRKDDLLNVDVNNDILLLKEEDPLAEVENIDILGSNDKPASVTNCNKSLDKSDCKNFAQNNLPSNNKSDNDNKCSNSGYMHQIEEDIDKEIKMEQTTLLENTSIMEAVDNSDVNQYNLSVQNNEMPLKNDSVDGNFSNSNCENNSTIQIDSQKNGDNETRLIENDNKHTVTMQNVKTTFSKRENDKKAVFCKVCNRSIAFRYYFEVHVRLHTGDKPFKCGECGKAFAKQYLLNSHNKTVHLELRPYLCSVCGKAFKSSSGIVNHKSVHAEKNAYVCSLCNKTFKHENSLKDHLLIHQNIKSFVCEVCGKAFINKSSLTSHMITHLTEKTIACPKCGKYFRKDRMRAHSKYHSDERPHACSYCDKCFKRKKGLRNHTLIHTGEKPFTCKICNKSFRQSCTLTLHMRSHTGETPYPCTVCPSKFKYSHQLRKHMKIHNESGEK